MIFNLVAREGIEPPFAP